LAETGVCSDCIWLIQSGLKLSAALIEGEGLGYFRFFVGSKNPNLISKNCTHD
jgi:hypothetical protein